MAKTNKEMVTEEKTTSFPSETLIDCREIVSQLVKRKGETTIPVKEIAIILGKSVTNVVLPISTCTQYGLLENVHGSGYRATSLYNRLEMPVFESDREAAILEALSNAPLYNRIIEEFNGKVLPDEQGMTNYLVKNFGIKQYIISKVVKVFYKNFNESRLIDSNNRLRFLASSPSSVVKQKEEPINEPKVEMHLTPSNANAKSNSAMFEQAIDLGDIEACLKYPRGMTEEQVGLLRIHLEATLTALEARFKKTIKKEQSKDHS